MRRREFILAGGATIAWPLAAWAQQPKRRIGVLMSMAADDPEGQARFAAFLDGLQKLGWTNGRNVRIDTRWPLGDGDRSRSAEELVALAPDLILASASASVAALQRITRSVPIVFANVIDPVGAGFVASLARPGGNTTGSQTLGLQTQVLHASKLALFINSWNCIARRQRDNVIALTVEERVSADLKRAVVGAGPMWKRQRAHSGWQLQFCRRANQAKLKRLSIASLKPVLTPSWSGPAHFWTATVTY
jgi:ABC-type uncharacterized transport system substrate-binding protein